MEEIETCWERYHAKCDAYDSYHIDPFYDDEAEWDIPCFMFPWSREKQHEENPVKPLFQTCTIWSYIDKGICVIAVDDSYSMIMCDEIDMEDMLQHPAALIEQ